MLHAIQAGAADEVRLLLEAGLVRLGEPGRLRTPLLSRAAEAGHVAVVDVILAAGAEVDIADADGWTPVTYADSRGHDDVVASLIAAGADPRGARRHGWTPVRRAVEARDVEAVRRRVVTEPETLELRDSHGDTPLYTVVYRADEFPDQLEILRLLLDAGADPNAPCNGGERPAWDTMRQLTTSPIALRLLLEAGTRLDLRDRGWGTLLHQAAWWSDEETLGLLLRRNPDLEVTDGDRLTPLLRACDPAPRWRVQMLLDAGANPSAADLNGGGCLHQIGRTFGVQSLDEEDARERDLPGTVALLVAAGLDPGLRDRAGRTALDVARAAVNHEEAVEALLAVQ